MKKINICAVTGSRAEYGILYWTLKEIEKSKILNLNLVVTGAHLSEEHGSTIRQIVLDGFKIREKAKILNKKNKKEDIAISIGQAIKKLSKIYQKLKPDILLITGDRYEIFAAATAAMVMNIPIAHIHGGEVTMGSIDDAIRHAITKMSHIHFASTSTYKKRILQLGESKKNVFNFGAPGIENIYKLNLLNKKDIESKLNTKFNKKNLLITFHPLTLENNLTKKYFSNLLVCLETLSDTNLYFTMANADANGKVINQLITKFCKNKKNCFSYKSLGQLKYLSLMKIVDCVIGNSSSGIIEAPSFKVPTINIGNRQSGRVKAKSIIDCSYKTSDIENAINICFSRNFIKKINSCTNPYYKKDTSINIARTLENSLTTKILIKKFTDL
ncbi:UDP-N-acetylglucosamine 2-epimerase [Pelagibacteraceae bacterium]|nr:UDP-N-acetylglucosamine 2-epimerase [Pelagibacteraceae bacterium]